MPSDSNLNNLPPSPIENEDLWLVNREDKSYKVNSTQLGSYIIQMPIPEACDDTSDCPSGYVCTEGYCVRQPCDDDSECPADHVCYNGYCYPTCNVNTGDPCTDGHICVDPGTTGGNPICLPYPFPIDPNLPGDGCPPGYNGYGDYCWLSCSGAGGNCPPDMNCVPSNWPNVGNICVPIEGGFPCADGACPDGYECFFGMCFAEAGPGGGCSEGFSAVEINGTEYCVPYPFPCDLYSPGCPDEMICYNGECYPKCTPGASCQDGFTCIDIGNGENICYPDDPDEKFVNDGPLVFKGEDDSGDITEKIIFTANQYGRSVINLKGFDITGGEGGGSGGEITVKSLWTDDGTNYKPTRSNRNVIPPTGGGNLGASGAGNGWDNVYTNDLHLSNEGKSNDVDGTWGDWTIQEGEDELYLLNNRNGKKYSFVLKEVIN